jgi:hypothetical protein
MEESGGFKPALKIFLVYVVFMAMYGLYKVFPIFPLSIICGIYESNFQHYKAIFFAFLIVDAIEFWVYRKQVKNGATFWYPRLLSATISPWPVFILWYIVPAVYGKLPEEFLEIIYANIMTILAATCTVTLERGFQQVTYTRGLKIVVWILLLISVLLYMVFTFSHLPWADVFIEPQWK